MDKIIQDNQFTAYTKDKALAETQGIIILENNPCFEIWLLLHFIHTGRLFNNCNEISLELRRNNHIPGYDKSEKFLLNAKLYQSYKHQLIHQAIPNAKRLEKNRLGQDKLYPRAQTFLFFEWYFENIGGM